MSLFFLFDGVQPKFRRSGGRKPIVTLRFTFKCCVKCSLTSKRISKYFDVQIKRPALERAGLLKPALYCTLNVWVYVKSIVPLLELVVVNV
jgi:hypothetical protein